MSYLIDTDWLADYLKGRTPAVELFNTLTNESLTISVITYGEIYEGIYSGTNENQHERGFLQALQGVDVLLLNKAIMKVFARIRSDLRAQGKLISDFDILIAATAIYYDLTLITRNIKHFHRIPHLALYNAT
jgi:tRNA(fMet)-specific endonuclease VapC